MGLSHLKKKTCLKNSRRDEPSTHFVAVARPNPPKRKRVWTVLYRGRPHLFYIGNSKGDRDPIPGKTQHIAWPFLRPPVISVFLWTSDAGSEANQAMLTKTEQDIEDWRAFGRVTPFRILLKFLPNVKLWSLLGSVTPCKLSPNVRCWRLIGRVTRSKRLLNRDPKVKVFRLLEKVTHSKVQARGKDGKVITKCRSLKTTWRGLSFQALFELASSGDGLAGSQGFVEDGKVVRILWGCCTCYPRDTL